MRQVRIPDVSSSEVKQIAEFVQQYFASAATHGRPLLQERNTRSAQELLMRIDAAVLDLYDLPADLEWQLLDLFSGWERGGVPFTFDRYFPEHFKEPVHLRDIVAVTYDWPKTNRRRGLLIRREIKGDIRPREAEELERLQRLADLRTDLFDPFDLEELEQLHAEIVTGANG